MRRSAQGQPIGVRASPIQLGNQFNAGFGRPPPSSPKFTPKAAPPVLQSANVSQVSPPKINIPNQVRLKQSSSSLVKLLGSIDYKCPASNVGSTQPKIISHSRPKSNTIDISDKD